MKRTCQLLLVAFLPFTIAAEGGGCASFGPISTSLTYDTSFGTVGLYRSGKGTVLTGDFGKRSKRVDDGK